jgi:hypothetical protein
MKQFGKQLFFFFLVFFIIVFTITRFDNIGRCHNKNANIQKLTCVTSFDSLDILFLGNSYCYSGVNTAYFDSVHIRSFNLGVATGGINYYPVLVNDYLASVKVPPRSVFLLVSPMTFSSKSDDAMNNPIYRYLNHPVSLEEYILTGDRTLLKNYPKLVARSVSRTFVNSYNYFVTKKNFCDTGNNEMYRSKGFIFSDIKTSPKAELKTKRFFIPLLKENFMTEKKNKLLAFANELEKKKIKVVFYELPSNVLYSYFNPGYLKAYADFIMGLRGKFTYIKVPLKLEKNYYRDQDHLNGMGAALASRNMITQIKTDSVLSSLYSK